MALYVVDSCVIFVYIRAVLERNGRSYTELDSLILNYYTLCRSNGFPMRHLVTDST